MKVGAECVDAFVVGATGVEITGGAECVESGGEEIMGGGGVTAFSSSSFFAVMGGSFAVIIAELDFSGDVHSICLTADFIP